LTGLAFLSLLSGCNYSDKVDVELRTNASGRLASARIVKPSTDEKFNKEAIEAARRRFPVRVPDAEPNQTYIQPVTITYPLIRSDKSES
jgi:TonB family protein